MIDKSKQLRRWIARKLARVPGTMEVYLGLHDALGRPPAFDSGWRRLSGWLQELDRVGATWNGSPRYRFLFFCDLPYHVDYCLALAVVLAGRDAAVDFAWFSHSSVRSEATPTIGYPY